MINQKELEEQLNSFDSKERQQALIKLKSNNENKLPSEKTNVNMHFHSFYSYNASWYSPSRIAWEARKAALYAAGLCDFDVLDGLEEFISAGQILGLRTTVNLETRTYFKEYADFVINSPREPGVTYVMGAGFAKSISAGSSQAEGLAGYRLRAGERNRDLINRINLHISQIAINYKRDVLPLTPAGAPTERHIVRAYVNKSKAIFKTPQKMTGYWSEIIERDVKETVTLLSDIPSFEDVVRSKLVKKGGIGYQQPSMYTFPPLDEFIQWVESCDAIPMMTWLDGTSKGEENPKTMLECMREKGAVALNIIPDRNWNVSDESERQIKIAKLNEIVEIASSMDLPINIGTEMNKLGLPFLDNLDVEALRPHREVFLRGARIMVGHTILLRFANYSYIGEAAEADFPSVAKRNIFFEVVGMLPPLDIDHSKKLEDMGHQKALLWLRDKTKKASK